MNRPQRVNMTRTGLFVGVASVLAGATGCRTVCPIPSEQPAAASITPARHISHVVFFDLLDGTDEEAFIRECRSLLGPIPGVTSLSVGRHLETGRDIVMRDYDVGVAIGLESADAYSSYLTHPKHLALIERWGPNIASYRVYDIEEAPTK